MTTTLETCRCECGECLALRAAEDDPGSGGTVAVFEHDGSIYVRLARHALARAGRPG